MLAAGQPKNPQPASDADVACFACDVLEGKTSWIHRRKEAVEIESETRWRHHVSVDFGVPGRLFAGSDNMPSYCVPLLVLEKQPGQFSTFDVVDETGRSIPMPTKAENTGISALALVEGAQRAGQRLGQSIPKELEVELRYLACADQETAGSFLQGLYDGQTSQHHDAYTDVRNKLMEDSTFAWLIRTLAQNSIVVFRIDGEAGARRILKLSYNERIDDVTRMRKRPFLARIGAIFYRLGWRGYLMQKHAPFIGASSFHFELTSPEDLQVIEAGIGSDEPWAKDAHHVHLYQPEAEAEKSTVVFAQFRVRGASFSGAALIATVIAAILALAWSRAAELATSASSAPTLLLLFPGLIASYLARPTHPLVERLLNLARFALLGSAAAAYAGAARLALISTSHPASENSVVGWFRALTIVAGICAGILILAHLLPIRLSHPVRKLGRSLKNRLS